MDVCVLVRTNTDYKTIDPAKFGDQERPFIPKKELGIVAKADLIGIWDSLFATKYLDYRQKIKELAESNLKETGLPIFHGDSEGFSEWYNSSNDGIVLPVDDDDWFCHNVKNVASHFDADTGLVCWQPIQIDFLHYSKVRYPTVRDCYLRSNNWAVKKSFLKSFPASARLVQQSHRHAWEDIVRDHNSVGCKQIAEHYGIYNHHLGSLSYLRAAADKGELRETLERTLRARFVSLDLDNQTSWATPYVRVMERILMRLRPVFL